AIPFLLGWAARPAHRLTALGRSHLKELQNHFGWVKDSAQKGRDVDAANMAFAVALFGGGAFASGIMYDLFNKAAVPPSSRDGGGCGGGCSSGCGGGGCGGGCGGCG
ncbi:MAG: hypothetical protein OEV92_10980, partial [Nitrospinota bacterium]|nr:hypothetical protein [Nitrospinota bacterium]